MFSRRNLSPEAGSVRSGGRWVGLGATAFLTAGALLVNPHAPEALAADCADAEVVFARGTDEPPGLGRVGNAFVDALRKQAAGLQIDTYAVDYKASKLQLHGGDGAKDAIAHIKSTVDACPDTQIVLGGYSQGANVINIAVGNPLGGITWGDSLPTEYADNIAAITTFGDVATRTKQTISIQSALYGSRAIDLCNPSDPICHEGQGNEWSGHTDGYIPAYTTQAAAFAAARLAAGAGPSVPGFGPPPWYGPETPMYGPQPPRPGPTTPLYGPQSPAYGPQSPQFDPRTPTLGPPPWYGPETSDSEPLPPVTGPSAPSGVGLVSAVRS